MTISSLTAFPIGVAEELKVYVYRLIDPRSGETFYVGKGRGNRVFQHALGIAADYPGELSDKLERVKAIKLAGLEVGHVIHRHGLDDAQAFEVEAALIDAYPGLTNVQSGHGGERGLAHAIEVVERYAAEELSFAHKVMMITINRTARTADDTYEAVRYAWKIGRKSAATVDFVLAVERGLVVGVFKPVEWLDATAANFPGREDRPGRLGFAGVPVGADIAQLYLRKRVPAHLRRKGSANPIKYGYPDPS